LEDEGQQIRDSTDNNNPTSSTTHSNGTSKVKQMARSIDTRSVSSRTGEHFRSSSPSPTNPNRGSDG
jgi:hypothetical protein